MPLIFLLFHLQLIDNIMYFQGVLLISLVLNAPSNGILPSCCI